MPPQGWVLYDGDCGFCRRAALRWEAILRRRGFGLAPLRAPWVAARLGNPPGLSDDIRLLTPAGECLRGEAVYLHVGGRIGWLRPAVFVLGLPGFRLLLRAAYRRVARSRTTGTDGCPMR